MRNLLNDVRKEFNSDSVMFLLGDDEAPDIEVRSSGSMLLDIALGGGYPKGRLVELSGKEKSGKTSLLNLAIAEAQRREPDKYNAVIDLEHSYNPDWAQKLGVDISKLFFSQPDTYAEKIFELIAFLVKTGKFAIIGLDSIPGLVPKSEFEEDDWTKDSRVGGTSKLNAMAIRKIVNSGELSKSGTTLIFINQIRDKIGGFSPFGTPTDTPGGHALKHAYTHKIDVSVSEYFTKGQGDKKIYLGQQTKCKVSKNKIAPPYRIATIDLYYEYGMDKIMELVKVAREIGVLVGTSWLKFIDPETGEIQTDENGREIKFNGMAKAREALVEDIENNGGKIYKRIEDTVENIIRG